MVTLLQWILVLLIPVGLLITYLTRVARARAGWGKFAHFTATQDAPHTAHKYAMQMLSIDDVSPLAGRYGRVITIWLDAEGIWMQPTAMHRAGHPLLHLPWREVASMEIGTRILDQAYILQMRGDFPSLAFYGQSGKAIYDHWLALSPANQPYPDGRNFGV